MQIQIKKQRGRSSNPQLGPVGQANRKDRKMADEEHTYGAGKKKIPLVVTMAPTRELANQVSKEFLRVAPKLRTITIYGGASYGAQESALRRGVGVRRTSAWPRP